MKIEPIDKEITHAHLFCGIGGGAIGFNRGEARVGALGQTFMLSAQPIWVRDVAVGLSIKTQELPSW